MANNIIIMSYKEKLIKNIEEKELPFKENIAYPPMSEFWFNIYKKYKLKPNPPLSLDDFSELEKTMPSNFDIPKDLKEYLLTFSGKININYSSIDIISLIKKKYYDGPNNNCIYIGTLDKDSKDMFYSGKLYLYLKKDKNFGTVWVDEGEDFYDYEWNHYELYARSFKEFFIRFFSQNKYYFKGINHKFIN